MNLKELFSKKRDASDVGLTNIRVTSNKETLRTPHHTMRQVLDMLEDRPSVSSGLSQVILFVLNEITFESSDPKTSKFMTEWFKQRQFLRKEMRNDLMLNYGVGTSYLEPVYTENGDLDAFFHVPDPSIIYKNLKCEDPDEDYWIMEVPSEVRKINGKTPSYHEVSYVKGDSFQHKRVWGITYPKEKYIQRKYGLSRTSHYGWGELCSAVNNEEVLKEITKNWSLMAKYRSLGKKIISFSNQDGSSVTSEEIDDIREDFRRLGEEESLIINKEFEASDLNFVGNDNDMMQVSSELKKENAASLVPTYMTAFANDANRATASEAKVPFRLKLESLQDKHEKFYTDLICKPLVEKHSFLANDVSISFGTPKLHSMRDLAQTISSAYRDDVATLNEYRKAIGLTAVEGGNVWKKDLDSSQDGAGLGFGSTQNKDVDFDFSEIDDDVEKEFKEALQNAKTFCFEEAHSQTEQVIKSIETKTSRDLKESKKEQAVNEIVKGYFNE